MKILLVITEMPPVRSGIALVGAQLAAGYRRAGHQVTALTRRDVGALGSGDVRFSGMAWAGARIRSATAAADVVHLHGPAPTFDDVFLGFAGRRGRRPPIVYTHHFDLDSRRLSALSRLYQRWHRRLVSRRVAVVVVTTEQYRERFARVPVDGAAAVEVVPLGCDHLPVDPRDTSEQAVLAKQQEGGALRVAFIGQMRPYKGVPVLLEAAARLAGVTCRLIGTGPELERYRQRARRLGADASFLGAVDERDLVEQLRWAQVVALPSVSTHEAFGLVLLEGMRFGCVPVGSELPGVSEVAAGCGLLTPPRDPAALAAALATLRDDPARRSRLALASCRRAARFTWQSTVDGYLRCLETAVASGEGERGVG